MKEKIKNYMGTLLNVVIVYAILEYVFTLFFMVDAGARLSGSVLLLAIGITFIAIVLCIISKSMLKKNSLLAGVFSIIVSVYYILFGMMVGKVIGVIALVFSIIYIVELLKK